MITVQEALEQGYIYAMEEGGEFITDISNILEDKEHYQNKVMICCNIKPFQYGIHDTLIEDMVVDHIDCQDEVYSEDLSAIAIEGCDDLFKQLTEKINTNLSKKNFYMPDGDIIDTNFGL